MAASSCIGVANLKLLDNVSASFLLKTADRAQSISVWTFVIIYPASRNRGPRRINRDVLQMGSYCDYYSITPFTLMNYVLAESPLYAHL